MSYYIIKKYAAKLLDFGRLSLLFLKLKKIICFFKHNLGVDKAKIRPIFLNNMQNKAVYFITSDDDFIASNRAKKLFEEHSADVADEMSKEIIDAITYNSQIDKIYQNRNYSRYCSFHKSRQKSKQYSSKTY